MDKTPIGQKSESRRRNSLNSLKVDNPHSLYVITWGTEKKPMDKTPRGQKPPGQEPNGQKPQSREMGSSNTQGVVSPFFSCDQVRDTGVVNLNSGHVITWGTEKSPIDKSPMEKSPKDKNPNEQNEQSRK